MWHAALQTNTAAAVNIHNLLGYNQLGRSLDVDMGACADRPTSNLDMVLPDHYAPKTAGLGNAAPFGVTVIGNALQEGRI